MIFERVVASSDTSARRAPWLSDRPGWTILSSAGLGVLVLLTASGLGSAAVFFGFVTFVGLGNGMTIPNASAGLLSVRPHLAGTASGLGSAIMIGLGRAVGETMIVLMAAGNTPLLDGSPFNGMRTMSAAIAVEIPEAPVGGTLFRVLFLTGFLLFGFTLVLTTLADQVGRVMRRKYGAQ